MASYQIEWKKSAIRDLRKLRKDKIAQILDTVNSLANNPYPSGYRKLSGTNHAYRIRIGDYRIIYTIVHNQLIIEIIHVGHRRDIYR